MKTIFGILLATLARGRAAIRHFDLRGRRAAPNAGIGTAGTHRVCARRRDGHGG
jgi:hypothetical protein